MLSIGEGSAVEVVDEGAGALVAALAGAVNVGNGLFIISVQRIDRGDEVLGRPGVGVDVNILVGTGGHECVIVDRHAVGGHDQRILIARAVRVEAGRDAGRVDLGLIGVVPHIGQIDHVALRAPVGDETLRSFHDEVGSGAALECGVDLIVAVGIVEILNSDGDAGVGGLKRGDERIDGVGIAPAAYRVCPEGDADRLSGALLRGSGGVGLRGRGVGGGCGGLAAGAQCEHHAQCKQHCEQFLHVVPP